MLALACALLERQALQHSGAEQRYQVCCKKRSSALMFPRGGRLLAGEAVISRNPNETGCTAELGKRQSADREAAAKFAANGRRYDGKDDRKAGRTLRGWRQRRRLEAGATT